MTARPPDPPQTSGSPYAGGSGYVPPPSPTAVPHVPSGGTSSPSGPIAGTTPPGLSATASPTAGPDLAAAYRSLTQGEQLILGGALLIVLIADGIGLLLAGAGGVSSTAWIASVFVLVAVLQRATGRVPALGLPYATVLVILGAIVGLVALHSFVVDVRFFRNPSVVDLLIRIAFYLGAATVAFGAYVAWKTPALRSR